MDLAQLALIGEFLGGLSVLLTMVYLAVQVRGNTRAMHSNIAQQTHDTITNVYMDMAKDEDLNRIFRSGISDLAGLSEQDSARFYAACTAGMYICENLLYQTRTGSADPEMANTFMLGFSANFHSPGFKSFWQERSFIFTKEIQEWVSTVQSQPPLVPGHQTFAPRNLG
jgi:CO/xanthine dehydrogenase Mo-binding subunit